MIEYTVRVDADGTRYWYLNGKIHREDGPAVENSNGDRFWYLNNKRHREDGPAIEYASGDRYWFVNDNLHREDGPAVEYGTGHRVWYLNGKSFTETEFKERMNPAKELTVADIEQLLGYRVKVVK